MVHRVDPQNRQSSCLTPETIAKLDRLAKLAAIDPGIMQAIEQAIETDTLMQIHALGPAELNHLKITIQGIEK